MPTTTATLTGTVLRTLGMVFGIPPYIKNGYYQKRVRKKERLSVYLTDRTKSSMKALYTDLFER